MYLTIIPKLIDDRMKEEGFNNPFLANRLYKRMNYMRVGGAEGFIGHARKDEMVNERKIDNLDEFIRNYSLILYALGIPGDHEAIRILRKYKEFGYPPTEGVPYSEVKEVQKLIDGQESHADPAELSLSELVEILEDQHNQKADEARNIISSILRAELEKRNLERKYK
jgi:hypothetical protein